MNNLSPKVQNQLGMLQQIQQQLQTILQQKAQYQMAVREAKRAQEEIKDAAEDAVMYMSVGTVMMQKKKEAVNTNLTEKVETLELRYQVPREAGEDAPGQVRAAPGPDQGGNRGQGRPERCIITFFSIHSSWTGCSITPVTA